MGNRIDPGKRFERERQRAKQEATAQQQRAREAIARKFASQGLTGSGADIKVTRQAQEEGAKRLGGRLEDIAGREEQQLFQQQQIEEQRKFQRGEREATQSFQAKQAAIAREMQAEQFAKQFGLSKEQFEASKEQFQQQFELSQEQFQQQFGLSQEQFEEQKIQFRDQLLFAKEQFGFQKTMSQAELKENIKNNAITQIQNLKDAGFNGPQINNILNDLNVSYNQKTGKVVVKGLDDAITSATRPESSIGSGPEQVSTGDSKADEILKKHTSGKQLTFNEWLYFKRTTGKQPDEYEV